MYASFSLMHSEWWNQQANPLANSESFAYGKNAYTSIKGKLISQEILYILTCFYAMSVHS